MLELSYPAVPGSVAAARGSVSALADGHGASSETLDSVRLAVSEAVTNVVEHAYPDGGGEVHITALVILRLLLVVVADDGRGMTTGEGGPGLGLGLGLIAAQSGRCAITDASAGGVRVEMEFDLRCPAASPNGTE